MPSTSHAPSPATPPAAPGASLRPTAEPSAPAAAKAPPLDPAAAPAPTEHPPAETMLEESRRLYEELVAQIPLGVYRIEAADDSHYRFIYASDRYCEITGVPRATMFADATSVFRCIHPDDRAEYDRVNRAAVNHRQAFRWEGRCLVHGQVRWLHAESHPSFRAEGRSVWTGIVQDITERKRAEEQRLEMERRLLHGQKLESLGVLTGGIAHDFNNLLMAILGNLDLALMDLPPVSPARGSIEQGIAAARRAADLTRQMLAYCGKGRFDTRELDLTGLVEENAHLFRTCVAKIIGFNLCLARDLPAIKADPGQIQQIIMNLITNASEAIGESAGVISLTTGEQHCTAADLARNRVEENPPPGRFVFLEVADTGCGMDDHTLQRLFDPFFTTKFMGRGLGMSAILGIVRAHHGAILIETELGRGSTVRVLFPASETAPGSAAPTAEFAPASHPPAAARGTILVVDDEDMVREVCQRVLQRHGWRVLAAVDGSTALELFQAHAAEIAAVILDLSMPLMDGVAVFRALRAIQPEVKVILSTGYNSDRTARPDLAAEGFAGFVLKPYTAQRLLSELDRVLALPRPGQPDSAFARHE